MHKNNEQKIFERAMVEYYEAREEREAGGSGQDAASCYEDTVETLSGIVERLLQEPNVVVAQQVGTINM
jgi:hypothetical protein